MGLKNVEQVGLDLCESESDTVKDNKDELVRHRIQKNRASSQYIFTKFTYPELCTLWLLFPIFHLLTRSRILGPRTPVAGLAFAQKTGNWY